MGEHRPPPFGKANHGGHGGVGSALLDPSGCPTTPGSHGDGAEEASLLVVPGWAVAVGRGGATGAATSSKEEVEK